MAPMVRAPRRALRHFVALLVVALTASCTGGSNNATTKATTASSRVGNAPVDLVLWHGYAGAEGRELTKLVKRYETLHPNVHMSLTFIGNLDYALQKVLTAIAGGKAPDIAYLYGSWAANIAQSPSAVALNGLIGHDPAFNWNDFWPGEREAATVGSKIIGIPALVDNLALVYNKKLFRKAGLSYPTPTWTWQDFRAAAQRLTDPATKQFGWAYVADGSEDTVWRFEAMLWQAGGSILTPDDKHAAFDSQAGIQALTLLQEMTQQDHSVYLDNGNGNYLGLFESDHIGMLWTGPWDLPDINAHHTSYGVQILPGDLSHQTISGPDNWVMFNNGPAREQAAWQFMRWFTAPEQVMDWSLHTCDLPIRRSVTALPQYPAFLRNCPGDALFVQNLSNVQHARPTLTTYPKISEAIGQAVQSVLLGKSQPSQALSAAAQKVNQILSVPS